MFINLTEYFEGKDVSRELRITPEADSINRDGIEYPILKKEDLILTVTNLGDGRLNLKGETHMELGGTCDRCLADVTIPVELQFDYVVSKPDGYHEISDDEEAFMDGFELDTEAFIYNEMIMSLPMKVLCKETCKGLCPVCGKNRNMGDCGCDTFVPDPRLAAIKDIFNANKEV
jgi:uncharacterized protein